MNLVETVETGITGITVTLAFFPAVRFTSVGENRALQNLAPIALKTLTRKQILATMHLTYPTDAGRCGVVESEGSAGAPVHEIEITPAMIEAGSRALSSELLHDIWLSDLTSEMAAEKVIRAALSHAVIRR